MICSMMIHKKKFFYRTALFVLVFASCQVFAVPAARAEVWGSNQMAALLETMLENMYRQIEGALLGTLKVQAIEMINRQLGSLIGGASGQRPLFITNYTDFLYRVPAQKTALYMNDFFTLKNRGKSSRANYIGIGDIRASARINYPGYLEALGRSATVDKRTCVYDLDEYTATPGTPFQGPYPFRALDAFTSNLCNNPVGSVMVDEEEFQARYAEEVQIAAVQAQSSGFLGVERNGIIVTPAGAIQAITANVQNMGNMLIATAENPGEFLSGVVAAMVNRTITTVVQQGIGMVESNIQRQVNNVNQQVNTAIRDATKQLGPAASYANKAIRGGSTVLVKINTPAPPAPAVDVDQAFRDVGIE